MLVLTAKGLLTLSAAWRALLSRLSTKLSAAQNDGAERTRKAAAAECAAKQSAAIKRHGDRVDAAHKHLSRSLKAASAELDRSNELATVRRDVENQRADQYEANAELLAFTANSLNERSQNLRSVSKLL